MTTSQPPSVEEDLRTSSSDSDCHFCSRLATANSLQDRLVFENDEFHVSHQLEDDGPTYLGLVLIQTKRHATGMAELTAGEAATLGGLIRDVSRALKSCTTAAWTYTFSFTEGFRHVHVIVAARYPGTPKEFVRLAITEWPGAPQGSRAEVEELAGRLRDSMRSFAPAPDRSRSA